ncbi:MAG: lipoyl synthase [Candidatus Krumholzibacteria bacterium]|nr:lipoyl synthase [Candidatus Krumholzibacteria bacterium]
MAKAEREPRPSWLKISLQTGQNFREVGELIVDHSLHTVCQEARCPNIYECWSDKTATFMILGDICTRHCGFCSVKKGIPGAVDPNEPENLARAAAKMGVDYAVVTSVDRDDMPDEGATHFAQTIKALRSHLLNCKVEVLIPDFNGRRELLDIVLNASPEVLAHNVETVQALYRRVRPVAVYKQSLRIIEQAARFRDEHGTNLKTKSGIMVGLGETKNQLLETIKDIAGTGCDIITVGQYLSPKRTSLPVERFYTPQEFDDIRDRAYELGFKHVESSPLVRSSYRAKSQWEKLCRLPVS